MVNMHVKGAVERLYEDTCTVYELTRTKDTATKITSGAVWEPLYEDIICRLSYKDVAAVDSGEGGRQSTKGCGFVFGARYTHSPGVENRSHALR